MAREEITARYLIETPLAVGKVAEVIAGEQSSGTFVKVGTETDAMRAQFRATVHRVESLPSASAPSLRSAWLERRGEQAPTTGRS